MATVNWDLIKRSNRQALTPDIPSPNAPPVSTAGPAGIEPGPGTPPPPPAPSGYNREALSQAVQGVQFGGGTGTFNPAEFIAQNQGGFAQGVTMVSPDKIRLPDGEIVDIGGDIGAGGTGKAWWGSEKDWQARNSASGGAMAAAERGAAGAPGAPGAPGGGDPFQGQIRALLLEQLGKFSKDPSIDDPALKGQSDAFRRAQERSAQQSRSQAAERAAFQGLNSGGAGSGTFETTLQGIREGVGERTGAFDAGLVGQETQQRRSALQNLLQMALSSGDAESARAIQLQIAQMDNALRQATLGEQSRQFDDQFGRLLGRDTEEDFRYRVGLV